jgi:hypothetical protein
MDTRDLISSESPTRSTCSRRFSCAGVVGLRKDMVWTMVGLNGVTQGNSVGDFIIPSLGLVIFTVCCTSEIMDSILPPSVFEEFDTHSSRLKDAARARKESVRCKNVVEDSEEGEAITVRDTLGKQQPTDTYDGDANLRTLRTLLSLIDDRGWERSPHQVAFHEKFEQCVSRVLTRVSGPRSALPS